jgi:adenosylcobinamide kinase/adenosylcobinamide-phosphate guanylyltransferase
MQKRVVLVGGGVRSGKSAFALVRARQLGERRAFIATGEALDDEMRERVRRHREERGADFETHEVPEEVERVLSGLDAEVVVIDCLTLWLSNLLIASEGEDAALEQRLRAFASQLAERRQHVIVVTNEVGLGIVPDNALARRFRDLTGRAHQEIGRIADEVYFGAMGQLLRLKPAPVEAVALDPD